MPDATHSEISPGVAVRAQALYTEYLDGMSRRASHMFAWLTVFEWLVAVFFTLLLSPRTWSGGESNIHPHIWFAVFLGGAIAALPISQTVSRPAAALSRHLIAASQMLMAGLLVHLTGGRVETHFMFFGLLALLAFYRDWKVLLTATLVTGFDHLLRGIYWPQSIYGTLSASPWRTAEHVAWVAFEVIFLTDLIQQSLKSTYHLSQRHAELESMSDGIAHEVETRTAALTAEIAERVRAENRLHLQNEISALVNSHAPLEQVQAQALRTIAGQMGCRWGAIWGVDSRGMVLRMTQCWKEKEEGLRDFETLSRSTVLRLGEGLPGKVWAAGDCHWIKDVRPDVNCLRMEGAKVAGLCSAFAFPVLQEDQVVEVMEFLGSEFARPSLESLETFTTIGNILGSYLANRQGERALRESERRYRLMFDDNPHPMWVYDLETLRFLAVNQSAIRIYGYSADEFQDMTILDIYPPAEAKELLNRVPGPAADPVVPVKLQHRTKGGKIITVEITSRPVEWKTRAADLVLANDVTDRERAQSEKAMMEVQLRQAQKLESIGQLAAGIAHEINTPTQYIGDNTRFLKDAFHDFSALLERYEELLKLAEMPTISREEIEKLAVEIRAVDTGYFLQEIPVAIQQALDGVERVATLVSAMKEFSHPGRREKTPVDLNKCIESTITVARNEWKYVADLETEYAPDLPMISCLPGEFNQVILNLIVNAAHAIAEANGNGSRSKGLITIQTRDFPDWVEIQVRDTGTGVPEDVRSRIFDPFFTTKEIGRGTGQGLAIAYSVIVEKHGGSINFDTEMGKGTTFKICLPHDGKELPSRKVMA